MIYFATTEVRSRAGCRLWAALGDHLVRHIEREEMAFLRGLHHGRLSPQALIHHSSTARPHMPAGGTSPL